MNKYHKCIQELGKLPGWVKVGAVAIGVGVGTGGRSQGIEKARAGKIKENTERTHTTTVNVAMQNRCLNFENANFFLPKTLIFVLLAVILTYCFARKKSKSDNKGK
ncbi:MAG: hypothetical protein IJ793_00890 [Opitutales bacterium]|nr:hypothetical protein [Opitutales bacterium]